MKKGFTLMEILIAIAIIAILTAIGIVSYTSINKNARNTKRRSDIEQIRSAFELYRADNGFYPKRSTAVEMKSTKILLSNPVDPPFDTYMSSIPTDPKGLDYYFKVTDLYSSEYYGYCIAAAMETSDDTIDSTCDVSISLPAGYNYARKNP
jgi:type II secretion system protein G